MSVSKKDLTRYKDITTASALSGKSVTAVEAYFHGAVEVCEISHSTGSSFIKFKQGQVEVGGNAEWGSGSIVN